MPITADEVKVIVAAIAGPIIEILQPLKQRIADLEAQQAAAAPQAAPPPPMAAPPPAAAPAGDDLTSQLMDLKNLMDQGVLSPEEFQQAKAKLLGS